MAAKKLLSNYHNFFQDIRTLLYPTQCVSCSKVGAEICPSCESLLESCREISMIHQKPLYSGVYYNETSSHLILSAKESNDRACSRYLATLMAMRFARLHRDFGRESYLFIPIPSSKKADSRRGFAHSQILAKSLAREVSLTLNIFTQVKPLLKPVRAVIDQSGLRAAERVKNIEGAFEVKANLKEGLPSFRSERVGIILVDDLVTTGSTMGEAIRALKAGFWEPDALLSACLAGRQRANKIAPRK